MEFRTSSRLSLTSLIGDAKVNEKMDTADWKQKLKEAVDSVRSLKEKVDLAEGAIDYERRRETELENDIHKERGHIVDLADEVRKARTRETEFAKNVYSWIEILKEKRAEMLLHTSLSSSLNATLSSLLSSIDALIHGLHEKRTHVDEVIALTDRRVQASQRELAETRRAIEAARDRREFLMKTKKVIGKAAKEDRKKAEEELNEVDRQLAVVKEEVAILAGKLPKREGEAERGGREKNEDEEETGGVSTTTLTNTTESAAPVPEGIKHRLGTIKEKSYAEETLPEPADLPIATPSQLSVYSGSCGGHDTSCVCECHDEDEECSCASSSYADNDRFTPTELFKSMMKAINEVGGGKHSSQSAETATTFSE